MDFALKIKGGHMGPRKFWRDYLPALKYHNPSVPMIVNRHDKQKTPPVMTIYLRTKTTQGDSAAASSEPQQQLPSSRTNLSKAPPVAPGERCVHLEMRKKRSNAIWDQFVASTRAKVVQPNEHDVEELRAVDAHRKQAAVDRERNRQIRAELKKEQEMLKRAREAGGMGATEED
ncbi:hypothetical protein HIM_00252 [Hirsutella minnesotensis 3608]|nr:hypothetical protein HIM_00252 [Hirsutella minnesotensis 3608]